MQKKEWFESWFDTSYYHVLYDHRDDDEAEHFIKNLVHFIGLTPGQKVLDLACGKGRHSRMLHAHDLNVIGVDLSQKSIQEAQKFEDKDLAFSVHDMREVLKPVTFDVVFNLFTSFGYFSDIQDNYKMIDSISKMLKPNGFLIIDFLNASKVKDNLNPKESLIKGGISFEIERKIAGNFVEKNISFNDLGEDHCYTERVQLFNLEDFNQFLRKDFEILNTFGDFDLNPFEEKCSPRLIIIAKKR